MSYRSFKHLLGETSLERKCRFIFGLGILVLVSSSFFWYGQKTESLVMKQTTQTARMLVNRTRSRTIISSRSATRTSLRSSRFLSDELEARGRSTQLRGLCAQPLQAQGGEKAAPQ